MSVRKTPMRTPRETFTAMATAVRASTRHSLMEMRCLASSSHSMMRSLARRTTVPPKMKRGTVRTMARGETRKSTKHMTRLKSGQRSPDFTSRITIGILKDCIEAWHPMAPKQMLVKPRLWISACSSQRRRPGRRGTSFLMAKVLMLQETVMMVTKEKINPTSMLLSGWNLVTPSAKFWNGIHQLTVSGNLRNQDCGGQAPAEPSSRAMKPSTQATSRAGVPKTCASRARARRWP
mmetsp:Transcript_44451/g.137438  ORF Transcript_44451/g.137438 Transcript_44451/m.137438 type:complete len:235 (+) Transcript_44451:860-1564(+)